MRTTRGLRVHCRVQWLLTSESASRTLMNACLVTPSRRAS
jgi:hypothetical protein